MIRKKLTFNQLIKKNKDEILSDRDQLKIIELKIDQRHIEKAK
ncbi:FbpB family small basic protein [Sporolactobacillus sp. CPB3-1]|uniref:FbpB family small basic protein n=1 Tax=Sporolactobacillus mangiferae TaxID=2940498 RepID=A0ABT0M949_9BACL|nr:FbpB family small basic protein [Sporolactobacillus mangiferae]MCL1631379.1 FbpB family small basic protein [Sporolactobacillus mangiferae]